MNKYKKNLLEKWKEIGYYILGLYKEHQRDPIRNNVRDTLASVWLHYIDYMIYLELIQLRRIEKENG